MKEDCCPGICDTAAGGGGVGVGLNVDGGADVAPGNAFGKRGGALGIVGKPDVGGGPNKFAFACCSLLGALTNDGGTN